MKMKPSPKGLRHLSVLRVAILVVALGPGLASACEVCYGAADSPWLDANRWSVYLLLGVTASVQVAFAAFFLRLRSRMKVIAAADLAAAGKGAA